MCLLSSVAGATLRAAIRLFRRSAARRGNGQFDLGPLADQAVVAGKLHHQVVVQAAFSVPGVRPQASTSTRSVRPPWRRWPGRRSRPGCAADAPCGRFCRRGCRGQASRRLGAGALGVDKGKQLHIAHLAHQVEGLGKLSSVSPGKPTMMSLEKVTPGIFALA